MEAKTGSVKLLEPVLDLLPTPAVLIEPGTARVVYANPAAQRITGGSLPLAGGAAEYAQTYAVFDEQGNPIPPDRHPGVRAARGETIRGELVDWLTPAGRLSVSVTAATQDGVVLVTFEDVTELQAARRRAALLSEATGKLIRSLDEPEAARAVAELVVPAYADWCFVELLQPDGAIVREAIAHSDPEREAMARRYDPLFPLDPDAPVGSPRVIRTGEPELTPEISAEFISAVTDDEDFLRALRNFDFRSSLVVPLRARGRVIGDLALANSETGRRFGPADIPIAQELADRCALALDNARLYAELREAEGAARRAGAEVTTILEGVADAITAQAPDGALVYANEAAVALLHYGSVDELLSAPISEVGARFEMLGEDGTPLATEQLPGRRALAGEDPEPLIVRSRVVGERDVRWSRVKAKPVRDEDGSVRLAINVTEDITELKRAEQGQRFLAEAGRVLSGSLDYEEALAAVARLAVPDIADRCTIDVPPGGQPNQPSAGVRTEFGPEAIRVPLRSADGVLGVLTLADDESGRTFGPADLELAEALASRAAAAVENSRLYRASATIARTLQASLLPPALPDVPGLELAAEYRAAGEAFDVGGDFYDVFSTAEDQWYAVVGDVCGKGAEAAAVTAMARHTIRAAAVRRRSPAAILRLLGEAMTRSETAGSARGRFCTIACVHIDLTRSPARVTVACGGHPLPVVVRTDGRAEELGTPGTLLGLVERPELEDAVGELAPGDTIVLYTDGLTEAGAPAHVWAPDELLSVLAAAPRDDGPQAIVNYAVATALGRQPALRDDIAVLALRAV
jgi:PAS domain S-box-containing protein